jgi:hypothetical protein
MKTKRKIRLFIAASIVSLAVCLLLGILTYHILLHIYPTLTPDGHRVMPIGHVMGSFLAAVILLPAVYYFVGKFLKRFKT